ncbi:hypothetical protein Tco_0733241 [Tanacetum coccineum]
MITSDSEVEVDNHVSLPPLPKLIGAEPSGTSDSLISLSDLTANMSKLTHNSALSKESKKVEGWSEYVTIVLGFSLNTILRAPPGSKSKTILDPVEWELFADLLAVPGF